MAGQAMLQGSIRAQDAQVREHLHRSLRRIAASVGQLHAANVEVEIDEGTPPLINAPELIGLARQAAAQSVGDENVAQLITANMGGEDFSYYLDHVPGCYVRFGAQVAGRESFPAHSSRFDFDEQALAVGAAYFANLARLAGQGAHPHAAGSRMA